jgi:outer membrane protein OmpA-like peptidoglycan-associated protein
MMTTTRLFFGVTALGLVCSACGASAPTPELRTARDAYSQARSSEATQLNPVGVHEAYKALSNAEAVHKDDPGSAKERNYAYIATRKSELAVAQASELLARKEQERAEADYRAGLERRSAQMTAESSQYAQQLNQTQQELQANTQELQAREQKVAELQAAAERAQTQLRKMESLREEEGRLIISLAGVLFEVGGNQLSAQAQSRLDTVAQALAAYPDRNIVVEGHTDDRGSDATNQQLSQQRADAVRQYLESRGVSPDRIRSLGRGESNPMASNDSAEGRANNRRVEIVVEPKARAQIESNPTHPAPHTSAARNTPPVGPDASGRSSSNRAGVQQP